MIEGEEPGERLKAHRKLTLEDLVYGSFLSLNSPMRQGLSFLSYK